MSKIFNLKNSSQSVTLLNVAKSLLLNDQIIAIPTDTIYGLAVNANSQLAIERLYNVKVRDFNKSFAICLGDVNDIVKYSVVTVSQNLLTELLPGAVTLLFIRKSTLNPNLNPGNNLVGIRIPNFDFVRNLCQLCGPIALTSANISNKSSCLNIAEFSSLWPSIDAIFDGGKLGQIDPNRLGSTIIDLSVKGHYRIVRDGCILDKVINILEKYDIKRIM